MAIPAAPPPHTSWPPAATQVAPLAAVLLVLAVAQLAAHTPAALDHLYTWLQTNYVPPFVRMTATSYRPTSPSHHCPMVDKRWYSHLPGGGLPHLLPPLPMPFDSSHIENDQLPHRARAHF